MNTTETTLAAALLAGLLFGGTLPVPASAQPETAPLVVMNLAAHPDDEDGSTLAYYRWARDAVAYSVIYTRGEGGQNEIGPQLYEELGAIRTRETLRAARHLGTQVHFLNFKDFGYSKTADETFERWGGRDEVTSRVVYLIRKLKPDVLFTNHDTVTVGSNRQHGHHQVVGLTAYDAFELAADPSYHPEQLEEDGVDLWQPKRLFHRLWSRPEDGRYDVAVPVGDVDAEKGISYAAVAARGLHEHASQGMEMFADRVAGWDSTYFVTYRNGADAEPSESDLAAGLPPNRDAAPDLDYWIDSGRIPVLSDDAVTVDDPVAVPGQEVRVSWQVSHLPTLPVRLRLFGAIDTVVVVRHDSPASDEFVVRRTHTPTIPKPVYQYERFGSREPLGYVVYDAPSGEMVGGGYVSMEIAPPVRLDIPGEVARFRPGLNSIPYSILVFDPSIDSVTVAAAVSRDADQTILDQSLRVVTGRTVTLESSGATPGRVLRGDVTGSEPGSEAIPELAKAQGEPAAHADVHRDTASLRLPPDAISGAYTVSLSVLGSNGTSGPATATDFLGARVFDVDVPPGLRVGLIASYDDTLEEALMQLGVDHVLLDSTDLAEGTLDDLHTVVVDIRGYLVRRDLRAHNDRLLEWVRRGGHLVVNYQKTFEWNPEYADPFDPGRNNPDNFAPYPLKLGRERVTGETAPVRVLDPDHVLVTSPNDVTSEDWDGWVQERGLYFPESYDARYVELFSLHDPGEAPLTGSTLLASHGEGTYLYTALVWYRQLKELHPGAFKIFANMISLPFTDGRIPGS